jgi:hypothetical protein
MNKDLKIGWVSYFAYPFTPFLRRLLYKNRYEKDFQGEMIICEDSRMIIQKSKLVSRDNEIIEEFEKEIIPLNNESVWLGYFSLFFLSVLGMTILCYLIYKLNTDNLVNSFAIILSFMLFGYIEYSTQKGKIGEFIYRYMIFVLVMLGAIYLYQNFSVVNFINVLYFLFLYWMIENFFNILKFAKKIVVKSYKINKFKFLAIFREEDCLG